MSEKPKSTKIPLGTRLKYYLDRLRMPKLEAEATLMDRLVSMMRKEINDRTIALKFGSDLLDRQVVTSIHELIRKGPDEIVADELRRMGHEKEELKGCVAKLERIMAMRHRISRIIEARRQSKGESQESEEALDFDLEAFLRQLEQASEESKARLDEAVRPSGAVVLEGRLSEGFGETEEMVAPIQVPVKPKGKTYLN